MLQHGSYGSLYPEFYSSILDFMSHPFCVQGLQYPPLLSLHDLLAMYSNIMYDMFILVIVVIKHFEIGLVDIDLYVYRFCSFFVFLALQIHFLLNKMNLAVYNM